MRMIGSRKADGLASAFHGSDKNGGRLSLSASDNTTTRRARQVLFAGAKHTCSIDPDGILRKTVRAEHQLQKPPAWAFDAAHIDAAKEADVAGVEVAVADTGRTYTVDFATFLRHAFTFNRGYGPQVGCELRHWTVSGPGLPEADPKPAQPVQLGLF